MACQYSIIIALIVSSPQHYYGLAEFDLIAAEAALIERSMEAEAI